MPVTCPNCFSEIGHIALDECPRCGFPRHSDKIEWDTTSAPGLFSGIYRTKHGRVDAEITRHCNLRGVKSYNVKLSFHIAISGIKAIGEAMRWCEKNLRRWM